MKDQGVDQKLMIVDDSGHTQPLSGDVQEARLGVASEDLLPSHLSIGWRVKQMSPFGTGKVLVLIEKEVGL